MTSHELCCIDDENSPDKRDPYPYPGNRWLIKAPDQIQSPFQDLIAHPNMAKYDLKLAAGKPAQKRETHLHFSHL
jgi:hypothetical protein